MYSRLGRRNVSECLVSTIDHWIKIYERESDGVAGPYSNFFKNAIHGLRTTSAGSALRYPRRTAECERLFRHPAKVLRTALATRCGDRTKGIPVAGWERLYQIDAQARRLLHQARVLGWANNRATTSPTNRASNLRVYQASHLPSQRGIAGSEVLISQLGYKNTRSRSTRGYHAEHRAKIN